MKPCDFGMCFHPLSHRAQFETQGFGHWAAHIYDEDPLKWVRAFQFPISNFVVVPVASSAVCHEASVIFNTRAR